MKTFRKLCKRFEKIHPGYSVWFAGLESCKGYYRIAISDERDELNNIPYYTYFTSCKEFSEWMDNVILD